MANSDIFSVYFNTHRMKMLFIGVVRNTHVSSISLSRLQLLQSLIPFHFQTLTYAPSFTWFGSYSLLDIIRFILNILHSSNVIWFVLSFFFVFFEKKNTRDWRGEQLFQYRSTQITITAIKRAWRILQKKVKLWICLVSVGKDSFDWLKLTLVGWKVLFWSPESFRIIVGRI